MSLGIQPMRNLFSRSILFFAAAAVVAPVGVWAEVVCSSDVSYTWAKSGADEGGTGGDAPAAPTSASTTQQGSSSQPTPTVVRFSAPQRAGLDEAGAKANLQIEVNRQKARASEQCKRDHESIGDCMATKLSARASILNSLSFSARAELEKALTKECSGQQGVCLSVDASEPQCRTISASKATEGESGDNKTPAKKPESKKK